MTLKPIYGAALLALALFNSAALAGTTTTTRQISNGADDVEQRADGSMYTNSSDLELVYDGGDQTIGLRFRDITVPQGATITNAYVQFTVDETDAGATELTIRAENTDNATAFSTNNNNVSGRNTTSASVNWQPPAWSSVGAEGADQRTPNLAQVIQAVVNRAGWQSGNAMALIITGTGARTAESYDGTSAKAPKLIIEYDSGNPAPTQTLRKRISHGADDVEERADGSLYTNSSDLELVYDGGNQTVGLRFRDLALPQGAVITYAHVQFSTDEINSGTTSINLRAEASDSSAAFVSTAGNLSNRSRTNASVNWQPPAWTTVGAAGSAQRTPDIKQLIQEVINRPGWQNGNNLSLILTGTGERTAESFEGASAQAAQLTVEYEGEASGGPDGPVKIAFLGDTGAGNNFQRVLNLIAQEGADLTLVAGDTSYDSSKDDDWDAMVRSTLGNADPVLIAAGNHDYGDSNFSDVRSFGESRLNNQSTVQCTGTYAEMMNCQIGKVSIVLSAIGSGGNRSSHETFIANGLSAMPSDHWRICAWHKNQRDMQVGGKTDEVGWTAYETCRQYGAVISTGHEHSYSRTHLLSHMSNKQVASTASTFTVEAGKTFAFVSGLGGIGTRDQERSGNWWASIYTSTQGAKYGVLFGTFYEDRAEFYFKNIDNEIIDQFTVLKGY